MDGAGLGLSLGMSSTSFSLNPRIPATRLAEGFRLLDGLDGRVMGLDTAVEVGDDLPGRLAKFLARLGRIDLGVDGSAILYSWMHAHESFFSMLDTRPSMELTIHAKKASMNDKTDRLKKASAIMVTS